ncbi:MAG: hypothetical protein ACO24H_05175 [Polynucleobacter sp.]
MSRTINTQDLLQLIHQATSLQDLDKSEDLSNLINTAVAIMALSIRRKFVVCSDIQSEAVEELKMYVRNRK